MKTLFKKLRSLAPLMPKHRDYEQEAKEARSTAEKATETLEASKRELKRIKKL